MATTPSVKVTKTFHFKGGTRAYSNRYHFNGGAPSGSTSWNSLFDAIVTAEKACYVSSTTITGATGYLAGSDVPVASKTYSTGGTLTQTAGSVWAPGEVCALLRYSTNARSTKNHPIYLFNYFHNITVENGPTNCDLLDPNTRSALGTYGALWISGITAGGVTAVRASPNGAPATAAFVEEYVTHRDFPYTRSA